MGEKNTQNIYSVDTCSCKSKQEIKHSENNESKSYRPPLRSLIHTNLILKNMFVFLLNGLAYFFCFSIPVTKYPDKSNLGSNGFVGPQFKGGVRHGGNSGRQELEAAGHTIFTVREKVVNTGAQLASSTSSSRDPYPGRGPIHSGSFSYTLTQSYVLRG